MSDSKKQLDIILRAQDLQVFIFRITSKKAKRPMDEFREGENNGMPVKYQYSVGARMQNYTLDLIEALEDAQYEKNHRLEHLTRVLKVVRRLNNCMWLCYRLGIVSNATAEEGEKQITDIKHMTLAWRNSTQGM